LSLVRSGTTYSLPYSIFAIGKIGVEILAHDRIDLSQFRCGINHIEMLVDSTRSFSQSIKKFNFEDSYDIVTLLDYKTLKTNGARFNKLYKSDGNPLKFYEPNSSNGIIKVENGKKDVSIKLQDFFGNSSHINFSLKSNPVSTKAIFLQGMSKAIESEVIENTLVVSSRVCAGQKELQATVYSKGREVTLVPAYSNNVKQVYLLDLRNEMPDSIKTCSGSIPFSFKDNVPAGTDYDYYSDVVDIKFQNGNLYDTLYLTVDHKINEKGYEEFTIGSLTTPLHKTISVTLKPKAAYTASKKTMVYHLEGTRFEYLGGEWNNDKIRFDTHELGQFTLLTDSLPPGISRVYCNSRTARFRISDNLSGISNYSATLNGEWLLMKYDYKTGILQSERFDKKVLLKGDFELTVTDRAGNEKIYKQKIL
jgi:hypothetical protein